MTLHLSPSASAWLVDGSFRLYRTVRIFGKTVMTPIWLAESLLVTFSVEMMDDGLPSDPGEAGRTTLAGIDSGRGWDT